jgi:CheY-like chemotaxis protein
LRVLIVEDDEFDRMTVKRLLLSAGFSVKAEECPDALSALRVLGAQSFDAVLLDFNLPGYDGLYVVRELRARAVRCPVVVLTGQDNAEVAVERCGPRSASTGSSRRPAPRRRRSGPARSSTTASSRRARTASRFWT